MTKGFHMTSAPAVQTPERSAASLLFKVPAHAYLARLAALHDEAAETAHLANLLGRAPWVAGAIGAAALITAVPSPSAASAPFTAWLVLVTIAVVAIGRAYVRTMEAPFDLPALKGFARSLASILLFAGAAWGAGFSLALPAHPTFAVALAFTAGISIVLSGLLRSGSLTLHFLAPATLMGALCAFMNGANGAVALGILVGGTVIAVATSLFERVGLPELRTQAR